MNKIVIILALVMLWGLFYLCIEPVRTWTDENIFNSQEEVKDENQTEETKMNISFDTHTLTIEV